MFTKDIHWHVSFLPTPYNGDYIWLPYKVETENPKGMMGTIMSGDSFLVETDSYPDNFLFVAELMGKEFFREPTAYDIKNNRVQTMLISYTAYNSFIKKVRNYNDRDSNKINKKTGNEYDENGLDFYGFNISGWTKNGINKFTGTYYDKDGFNQKGRNREFINKDTGTKYDKNGLDYEGYNVNGYDTHGYDRYGYDKDGYDRYGFNKEGINKRTQTPFDKDGYDMYGYDKNGNRKGKKRN